MESDLAYEEQQFNSRAHKAKEKKNNTAVKVVLFLVSIGLWSAIVYFGYTYAKDYVDTSVKNVQQENAMNIKDLKEQITSIGSEIRNLKNSMEDAGLTITNSSGVQERIDNKLKSLDDQLQQLEKSLKILKEAP